MHTFDVTPIEYWEIWRATRWLRNTYSLEEIADGDVLQMFEPYRSQSRYQFCCDDVMIAFIIAEGKARIGISLKRMLKK